MLRRPLLLLLPLLGPACRRAAPPPAPPAVPIGYRHLTPLPLNVAALEIEPTDPPAGPADLGRRQPIRPAEAVRRMGQDRLSAVGLEGSAHFAATRAALFADRGGLSCGVACRLEIRSAAGDPLAFVEAEARASVAGAEAARADAGERLLRRAMDDLNVEFEYQLRRTLRDWLAAPAVPAAAPAPVEREELPRG